MFLQFWLLTIGALFPANLALNLPLSNILDEGREAITDIVSDITNPIQDRILNLANVFNTSALANVPSFNIDLTAFDLFKKQKTFTELANEAGLDSSAHYVTTEDGYILTLFHVPGTGDQTSPVLLMHGILDSADTWVLRGNTSIVRLLVDSGYDVWLGNARGSRYSRNHTTKDPDSDKDFWEFSFHEIGKYDLPALIDFVLNQTGVEALHTIGHSQGNQIFWVMASERPEYNPKIKMATAMAPVSYIQNMQNSILQIFFVIGPLLGLFLNVLGVEELVNDRGPIRIIEQIICSIDGIGYEICLNGLINPAQGFDNAQLEPEFFKLFMAQYPSSTSIMNGLHLVQAHNSKKFGQYDRGIAMNLQMYNSTEPPEYDLSKVTMKVVLMVGSNDYIATVKDAEMLRDSLPNVEYIVVDDPNCTHLDFVWGSNATSLIYEPVLKILKDNP